MYINKIYPWQLQAVGGIFKLLFNRIKMGKHVKIEALLQEFLGRYKYIFSENFQS